MPGQFINSKVPLRCRIVSIHSAAAQSENPTTTSSIHQVGEPPKNASC
jgi:hypothetical protein